MINRENKSRSAALELIMAVVLVMGTGAAAYSLQHTPDRTNKAITAAQMPY